MSTVAIARTVTIPDAAQRLGITTLRLYQLIDAGAVPAIKTAAGHLEVQADLQLPPGHEQIPPVGQ